VRDDNRKGTRGTVPALSANSRAVLYRLQVARGGALYVIPSLASPWDRESLVELKAAGLVLIRDIAVGIILRPQAVLTDAGRAAFADNPWDEATAPGQST